MRADASNPPSPVRSVTSDSTFWRCALSVEAIYLHIMQDSRHKRLKMGFLRACAPSRFRAFFLLNPLVCLKKPYISGIFSFEIRHVRYMPIDVGAAHNHTVAVGKPSILIALISDIPNPAPPPAILMSDVRNVSGRCANCCHLRRNCTGISCRTPCYSHAPNIQNLKLAPVLRQSRLAIEDRPSILRLNRDGHADHQRAGHKNHRRAAHDVKQAA